MKEDGFSVAGRPGYFGKRRDETHRNYDLKYGKGNWKIGWAVGENLKWSDKNNIIEGEYHVFDFIRACKLYEDAYYRYFKQNKGELDWITENSADVYDNALTNVNSGLDYGKQEEGIGTHIQDIAIRNVIARFGKEFEGKDLLQIRVGGVGEKWNPAHIPFHKPEWILRPELNGWWDGVIEDSVECFYQSNKVLLKG